MSRVSSKKRHMDIVQKRERRGKLKRLKTQYQGASNDVDKKRVADKIRKIAPYLLVSKYLEDRL